MEGQRAMEAGAGVGLGSFASLLSVSLAPAGSQVVLTLIGCLAAVCGSVIASRINAYLAGREGGRGLDVVDLVALREEVERLRVEFERERSERMK